MKLTKSIIKSILNKQLNNEKITINLDDLQKIIDFCLHNVVFDFTTQIDDILIRIANQNNLDIDKSYATNSFLHIFSQVYLSGGHTRVGERWIKYSPNSQKHSVVITKQDSLPIPELLRNAVADKNGDFIVFDNKDSIELALQLREIASKYEFVILHIHMNDLIPVIALGSDNFNRKILFFNHADHEFWIGGKIANLVVNLRGFAVAVNEHYRGIYNNVVLPLPIEKPNLPFNINTIAKTKKELGISFDNKVIITVASVYKYKNFDNYDWIGTAKKILDKNPNTIILAIGPSINDAEWKIANNTTDGKIIPLGIVSSNQIEKYLQIADLAIDSYPFGSFTALLDIAKYNIECLSLVTAINHLDSFVDGEIYCINQLELVNKATKILSKKDKNLKYFTNLYKVIEENHFPSSFVANVDLIYKITEKYNVLFSYKKFITKPCNIKNFINFNRKMKNSQKKSFIAKFKKSIFKRIEGIKNKVNENKSKNN